MTENEDFDQSLLLDRRMWRETEVEEYIAMINAAMVSPHTIAYPVNFHGSVVTALGYQRGENEVVPICLLLPQDEWVNVPQVTDHWNVVRTSDG